jgi:sugar phosphate isomerase/epimerase
LESLLDGLKASAKRRQQFRPLNDSDYDLAGFLALVKKVGYRGPVSLQCWSIGGARMKDEGGRMK